jgi:hypothetical protein
MGGDESSAAAASPPLAPHTIDRSGALASNSDEDPPRLSADADAATAQNDDSLTDAPIRPRTLLQFGIRKEKKFTDGTMCYGLLVANGETNNLDEAL